MPRPVLDESAIHPAVRETISASHADIVREVQAAVADNDIVALKAADNVSLPRSDYGVGACRSSNNHLLHGQNGHCSPSQDPRSKPRHYDESISAISRTVR